MSISRFTVGFTQTLIQLMSRLSRCPFQWEQNLRFSCEVSWSQVPVWWISEWLRYWCPTGDPPALDGPDVCPRPTIYQRGAVRVAWSQEKRNWVPGDVESLEETSRMCHVPHVPHVLRTFNARIDKSIKDHMALFKGWRPSSAPPDFSRPSISSQCGLESFWMGTCFRNIFLMFFENSSWNRNFVGNRRLFWGASEFPKAPAKGFSRRTAANFNLLLRVKAPLCKDFSV